MAIVGESFIAVPGGRAWVEVAGEGGGPPLLLLHGGPGIPSYYLEPLRALADERQVIFYDQLGCGRADRPDDVSLWTVDRFADELTAVREALALDDVHILGHSWGTMLAVEHVLRGATGVRTLTLSGPCMSTARWVKDTGALVAALPAEHREAIERNEAAGTFEAEDYQAAATEFAMRHISRYRPFPHPLLQQTMGNIGEQVYGTMAGPSEFTILGNLRGWDRSTELGNLTMPVLWTCGRYDEAIPATVEEFARATPNGQFRVFEESGHMVTLDEPEAFVETVRAFLRAN